MLHCPLKTCKPEAKPGGTEAAGKKGMGGEEKDGKTP